MVIAKARRFGHFKSNGKSVSYIILPLDAEAQISSGIWKVIFEIISKVVFFSSDSKYNMLKKHKLLIITFSFNSFLIFLKKSL